MANKVDCKGIKLSERASNASKGEKRGHSRLGLCVLKGRECPLQMLQGKWRKGSVPFAEVDTQAEKEGVVAQAVVGVVVG